MNYSLVASGLLLWCAIVGHNGLAMVMDEKVVNASSSYSSYKDALGKAILFFEGQRSGKLPSKQRVHWRGDSALSDGNLQNLFDLADKFRGSYSASCPFYCSFSSYQDELLWAASWLYKASGEMKYLDYALSNQGWSHGVAEFSWDNKFIGAQTLLTKEFYNGKKELSKIKGDAESFICSLMPGSSSLQIKTTPGGLLFTRDNVNLQYVTSSTLVLMVFSNILKKNRIDGVQCGSVHFSRSQIKAFAKSQVDYILGKNPMNMSYMVGFGRKYPQQLHHRGSSIPSIRDHPAKVGCNEGQSNYLNSPNPNPNIHVGAIVGGPDSNDHFNDARSDFSHNEPAIYINAAFVGSVASLLGKNK
ncbi:unnamed protein product [Lupinus luteus]|uniref:Endoglucanase n=1 Tax=Lupinus luteus TaxID=3873 RepID=A0AAV1YDJ7_LUPLU